jgi:hypothetical protein
LSWKLEEKSNNNGLRNVCGSQFTVVDLETGEGYVLFNYGIGSLQVDYVLN